MVHVKKQSQQQCQKARARNDYICNLANAQGRSVTKKLWSFIKQQKNDYCGVAPLQDNGVTYNDPESKAQIINKAFSSVFTHEDVSTMPMLTDSRSYPDMPPIQIDPGGILHLLLDLKPNKAPGPDKIPACLLKELAYKLAPVLAVLYRATLEQSCLPTEWKNANIVPIFKNDRSCPLNYRPVSLTSICCSV